MIRPERATTDVDNGAIPHPQRRDQGLLQLSCNGSNERKRAITGSSELSSWALGDVSA